MREKRTLQQSIFHSFSNHQIGRELEAISAVLDEHPEMVDWVHDELPRDSDRKRTGRPAVTAESVLRGGILMRYLGLTYEELAFHLTDSISMNSFVRLPFDFIPKKSSLHGLISLISPRTWERINGVIVGRAANAGLEDGRRVRLDSTAIQTDIHHPTDSSLLWDGVRVSVRLLREAEEIAGRFPWHNHQRKAKRRLYTINTGKHRGARREQHYRDLVDVTERTVGYLEAAAEAVRTCSASDLRKAMWLAEVGRYQPLIERVIAQTQRRVFHGEKVPADEKVFSLFEDHTDIIVKGARDVVYGHKLNLVSGASGLVLDVVVEAGNPADSARFIPMVQRQIAIYECAPDEIAADGCYASRSNLAEAKELGIREVAFEKKCGLRVEEMTSGEQVFRRLRKFRAGIEAVISCLKRAYGLARCTWKGLKHFQSYVWSAVVANNLATLVRATSAKPAPT